MQYLYAAKQWGQTRLAGLLFVDEFGKYKLDSVKNIAGNDTGWFYGRHFNQAGVNTRVTGGLLLTTPLQSAMREFLDTYYLTLRDLKLEHALHDLVQLINARPTVEMVRQLV